MWRLPRSPLFIFAEYLLASLVIGLTTGALYVLGNWLDVQIVTVVYLLPVMIGTLLWGLGPGIFTAILAFLAFNYFFIPPQGTLLVYRPQDLLVLLIFLFVAVVLSQLLARTRTALAAAQAREHEAIHLYELSAALAGQADDRSIARTLAQYTLDAFQADRVEVTIEAYADHDAAGVVLPPDQAPASARSPLAIVPLLTARGLLGEIHLWADRAGLAPAEDRQLKIIANQGALALERSHLARSENRAKVAEESDRMKTVLLSSVSHELRTPLAAIKAAVTGLRGGTVDRNSAARDELLATIDEETDQLNTLVGNLLDMSRIEAGALKPERRWNDVEEIIGAALARLKQAVGTHRVQVIAPDDLPLAPVDFVQLQQVFTNLISNSLKYSPPGTTIRIEARPRDRNTLLVRVINQGPPVPEEHLERIFDKFYRVTASDRITGAGLGLSICKGIVEAHGGRIWAENLPDGLAFNFTLPLQSKDLPPLKAIEQE